MTEIFISDTKKGIEPAVKEIFTNLEISGPIIKKSKEVYIKVNGIDFKKHAYTSPLVLREVIKFCIEKGAKVYVMENSTQANMTRIVFEITGYRKVCEELGAQIIYLDEQETETFEFKGKPSVKDDPNEGYILKKFRLPKTIVYIINNRETLTYINIPKLKTHSMAGVTLGIKNQWGFPQHADRGKDHNYNLHSKIVDVYEYIKPDITIIDGTEGLINGHYPPTAWEDRLVKKFNILIGGRDTLAVDVVGARIFGLSLEEIPHLKIAHERGLGEGDLNKMQVNGKDLDEYKDKYSWDLLQRFPEDVMIVKGSELLCKEGCQNNPLATLQSFAYDYPEKFKGGWFLVMGKGHDKDIIEILKEKGYTKGLVAGYCAINEVGEKLRNEFGKRKVFFSGDCNNLAETVKAILKLSGMTVFDLVSLSTEELMSLIDLAKEQGSTALIPL
ncbi:MAG: DUF362 domain-containing protein [Candidatus Hermodarchaeota archaeon]